MQLCDTMLQAKRYHFSEKIPQFHLVSLLGNTALSFTREPQTVILFLIIITSTENKILVYGTKLGWRNEVWVS